MKFQTVRGWQLVAATIFVGFFAVGILASAAPRANANPNITSVAGANPGQTQTVTLAFECLLAVQVFDASAPAQGATVVFASPPVGASALLTDTTTFGSQLTVMTDSNGVASVIAIADVVPGNYGVTATLTSGSAGLLSTPILLATFPMTNLAIGEQLSANGFEAGPALCGSFAD